jgi:hypothetical protein
MSAVAPAQASEGSFNRFMSIHSAIDRRPGRAQLHLIVPARTLGAAGHPGMLQMHPFAAQIPSKTLQARTCLNCTSSGLSVVGWDRRAGTSSKISADKH